MEVRGRSDSEADARSDSSHVTAPLTINCLFASMTVSLGAMTAGAILSYPSPAISDINNNPNPYYLTKTQQSWYGSVAFLGSFVGTLLAGLMMDRVGRKVMLMITTLPAVIGWEIIIASRDPAMTIIGRSITGFGRGLMVPTMHVYIAEIAPAPMRGTLLTVAALYNVLGNLYEYLLGNILHWNWLAVASMAIPLVMCVLMCMVPETPRFLMQNGRMDEAEVILQKLRGDSECIENEMQEIEDSNQKNHVVFHCFREGSFLASPLWKPLLISFGICTVREFSGNSYLRTYALTVIQTTGMPLSEANRLTIVVGLVGVAGVLVSCVLVDRVGRRTLLVVSCVAMALCSAAIGVHFKMLSVDESYAVSQLYWLGPIGLVLSNFSYAIAFDSIPSLIVSEIFPTRARGKANSIVGCWQSLVSFLATFFFMGMDREDHSNCFISFLICAALCLLSAVLLFFIVPETKKETLENIQSKFHQPELPMDLNCSSTYI